uniref:Uncharacterized protein n=1 Tax=Anguilla anguilla TaxID=7936 RepID=A0A0E9XJ07_ANGAN
MKTSIESGSPGPSLGSTGIEQGCPALFLEICFPAVFQPLFGSPDSTNEQLNKL